MSILIFIYTVIEHFRVRSLHMFVCIEKRFNWKVKISFLTVCADGSSAQLPIQMDDSQLSASSSLRPESGPQRSHLSTTQTSTLTGGWVPAANDKNQWLMISFQAPEIIYAVSTRGQNGAQNWVTAYYLMYSLDGRNFTYYQERGQRKVGYDTLETRKEKILADLKGAGHRF